MGESPAIHVVVPAFNEADSLGRCLSSICNQSFEAWTATVIDDGSTDDTAEVAVAHAEAEPRFTVHSQLNQGLAVARNSGLRNTQTPLVLFLDADDEIEPDHLASLASLSEANPEAPVTYSGGVRRWINETGPNEVPQPDREQTLFHTLARSNPFFIHMCLFRTDVVTQVGGFDERLPSCEDWDLLQRLARQSDIWPTTGAPTAVYWQRRTSMIRNPERMLTAGLQVIERAYETDPRVPQPLSWWRDGIAKQHAKSATFIYSLWVAGVASCTGQVQVTMPNVSGVLIGPADLCNTFLAGVQAGKVCGPEEFSRLLASAELEVSSYFEDLLEQAQVDVSIADEACRMLRERVSPRPSAGQL